MASSKSSPKVTNKPVNKRINLIVIVAALSLTLNFVFVVAGTLLLKTTYFDLSVNNMLIGRDFDSSGCYTIAEKSPDGAKACLLPYIQDKNGVITAPTYLKGVKASQLHGY